jgi:3-hydroxy-3-methylglutaryl CoA synthase
MAVEAGRAALRTSAVAPQAIALASTSLPFADRANAGILRSALGLPNQVLVSDAGGSQRAGSTELLRALSVGARQTTLVVASEQRLATPASNAELSYGDGAAAALVGSGKPLAVLLGSASEAHDFVDHFREAGRDADYNWEERWVREEGYGAIAPPVAKAALEAAGCTAQEIDHFILPSALPRVNTTVAKQIGIRADAVTDALFEHCGDTGAAHPLLMLAEVLSRAQPGQKILLLQFGSGCDALVLETTQWQSADPSLIAALAGGRVETNYMKFLSFTGRIELAWGMRAEMDNKTALSAAWRNEALVHGFNAGACSACGTVQFPSSRLCVNPACVACDSQRPHRLADEAAHIRSYTCDWLSYRQCPPFQFGHVEFASGARVMMEFTDSEPEQLAVGVPLVMRFRIKDVDQQRGFRRYFWKAQVVQQGGEA